MRATHGRLFAVAIIENALVLVVLLATLVNGVLSPRVYDPDPNSSLAGVGDFLAYVTTGVYIFAFVRYAMRRGWLGLAIVDGFLAVLFLLLSQVEALTAACLILSALSVVGLGAILGSSRPTRARLEADGGPCTRMTHRRLVTIAIVGNLPAILLLAAEAHLTFAAIVTLIAAVGTFVVARVSAPLVLIDALMCPWRCGRRFSASA